MPSGVTYPSVICNARASFDVICLANAKKQSERCVAGIRADNGAWVRAVSAAEHGELTFSQRKLKGYGELRNFDLVRIGFAKHAPTPGQPENWLIDGTCWELVSRPAPPKFSAILAAAVSQDQLLFGSSSVLIPATHFDSRPAAESLVLVKPRNVRWITVSSGLKRRARVSFELGNLSYRLPLTDPPFENKLKSFDDGSYESAKLGIHKDERMLFSISLGEPFEGNCYKLVAGVLLPPEDWPEIAAAAPRIGQQVASSARYPAK